MKEYENYNIRLVPLKKQSKEPYLSDWRNNKKPVDWFKTQPELNVGILTGDISEELVDIDIDDQIAVQLAPYFLPTTDLIFGRAGRPKSHWLYRTSDEAGTTKRYQHANRGTLVEYRADGCQTMAPPSIHPCGENIEFNTKGEPAVLKRAELLSAVGKLAAATLLVYNWTDGIRHDLSLALSGALLRSGWTKEKVISFIGLIAKTCNDHEVADRIRCAEESFSKHSIDQIVTGWPTVGEIIGHDVAEKVSKWLGIENGSEYTPSIIPTLVDLTNAPESQTDIGNARRFADRNRDKCFFHTGYKCWFIWSGKVWVKSDSIAVHKLANETAVSIFEEADGNLGLVQWAKASCSKPRLTAMLDTSKTYLQKSVDSMNNDHFVLNVQNGTINLKTMELKPHNRNDYIDQIANVTFDPHAECPRFRQFIDEIFNEDEELKRYVQAIWGYSLTGDTSEQKMFIGYGSGANGKGVLSEVLKSILGEYATTVQAETLMQKQKSGSNASPDLARLVGKRAVFISEGDRSHHFDEALVKQLTGQDTVTARGLYQEHFEFMPCSKYTSQPITYQR